MTTATVDPSDGMVPRLIHELAAIASTLLVSNTACVLAFLGSARLAGLRPTRARFFGSPQLFETRLFGTPLGVGVIPTGSFVEIPGMNPFEDEGIHPPEVRLFWQRPRWMQALLLCSYPILLVTLATILIGPSRAAAELGRGFVQVVSGAMSPHAVGAPLVGAWSKLLREDTTLAIGVLLAKLAALELLPVGSATSFRAAIAALGLVRAKWPVHVSVVLMLAGLVVAVSWLLAFVAHARG